LALDKILKLEENSVDLATYDKEENLVWKMLEVHDL